MNRLINDQQGFNSESSGLVVGSEYLPLDGEQAGQHTVYKDEVGQQYLVDWIYNLNFSRSLG